MKAEDILNDNLPFGDSTYMGECKQEVLNAMEEYANLKLQALKEEVEERRSEFIRKRDSFDGMSGLQLHQVNRAIKEHDWFINLITNLEDNE